MTRLPEVTKAALLTLSIPCTNVEMERSFSAYSRIVTQQRHRLLNETTETLEKLHFNQNL